MPNARGPGQKLIGAFVSNEFAAEVDTACQRISAERGERMDRSDFVRTAILEALIQRGHRIPKTIALPPPRARAFTQNHFGTGDNNFTESAMAADETDAKPMPKRKDPNYLKDLKNAPAKRKK